MEPTIEYVFGSGDGTTQSWTSPPDLTLGSGGLDAVRIDFDGDGRLDDAMWDRNADGRADCSVLDLDDDGRPDAWYTDDGSGVWGRELEQGDADLRWSDPMGEQHTSPATTDLHGSCASVDVAGDGGTDDRVCDRDSDGLAEIVVMRSGGRLYLDTDLDSTLDQVIVDSDLDGTADAALSVGQPGFGL
ncbi:hypothetical protein BH683_019155 [Williamsia sp. 1138]|uniref:VCBS repeat-containing protein n=1 Tax=Gordonia rubripertincta TaxID=36822 RepID=A0ABT4MRF4_GORRU|nr:MULTISPECIES: hypothetical protein [Mycobacteriales]MCZ4549583.1 hypothetical protein [Gordonia rubripertincta]OZG27511.1 hypothetical protein BH683_019155 [Williamsia sp. 1138]